MLLCTMLVSHRITCAGHLSCTADVLEAKPALPRKCEHRGADPSRAVVSHFRKMLVVDGLFGFGIFYNNLHSQKILTTKTMFVAPRGISQRVFITFKLGVSFSLNIL